MAHSFLFIRLPKDCLRDRKLPSRFPHHCPQSHFYHNVHRSEGRDLSPEQKVVEENKEPTPQSKDAVDAPQESSPSSLSLQDENDSYHVEYLEFY